MMLPCHQEMLFHFFGVVQKIYVSLSAFPRRWSVLKKHVTQQKVKPLSDT
jgi:nitrate reductase cytochrome c-type subunit